MAARSRSVAFHRYDDNPSDRGYILGLTIGAQISGICRDAWSPRRLVGRLPAEEHRNSPVVLTVLISMST